MKYLKKFESFINEEAPAAAPAPIVKPSEPITKPETPTKPERPTRPEKTPDKIEQPGVNPDPKAETKTKVTALDVAKRFIEETNKKGESVEKYLK